MVKAVVDLGSNTFHLLIGEIIEHRLHVIYKERRFVFLAENGVGSFSQESLVRASETLENFKQQLQRHQVTNIKVIGTAAVRHASNRHLLDRLVESNLGVAIDVIDGITEAKLIGQAVIRASGISHDNFLAIDIGGGSTEIIHYREGNLIDAQSHPIGIAVLHQKFHSTDPIPSAELKKMKAFITSTFQSSLNLVNNDELHFIGVAGTFEVLGRSTPGFSTFQPSTVYKYLNVLSHLDHEARAQVPYVPQQRAKYIVEALSTISSILDSRSFLSHLTTSVSLKEGALYADF